MAKRFRRSELLFMSLVATLSMLLKPHLRAPFAFVQLTFGLPVGVFLGGVYMFWPVLVTPLIPEAGSALIVCAMQGFLALLTGFTGLLGPAAFFSYVASGVAIEAVCVFYRKRKADSAYSRTALMLMAGIGNAAGAFANAMLFFALRGEAAAMALGLSFLSGTLGGWFASVVAPRLALAYPAVLGRRHA